MNTYSLLKPALFCLPPETAHNCFHTLARVSTRSSLLTQTLKKHYEKTDRVLHVECLGFPFKNPVGLAAGFDKNAEITEFMSSLGFGFLEVGAATAQAAKGNPRPRLFRLPKDEALINRMGLNNKGAQRVSENLKNKNPGIPVGVNIAKTHNPTITGDDALEDFVVSYTTLEAQADFLTLNVSCPNSNDGRTFEHSNSLEDLLHAICQRKNELHSKTPILVKFSNDISFQHLEEAIAVCEAASVDGYVLTNTSVSREALCTPEASVRKIGIGGLSGTPIQDRALERIRFAYKLLKGKKPIIGVGGINSPETAYSFICAGASLVEIYTGLVYKGPGFIKRINSHLVKQLKKNGFSSLEQAIGSEHQKGARI